jgi:FkbM family methyltransferase
VLRQIGRFLQAQVAKAPRPFVSVYLSAMSLLCRYALPGPVALRVGNSITSVTTWADIRFEPRRVTVGAATRIWLIPHLGEFDGGALFSRRLSYERAVFAWFERDGAGRYDNIIEIGANVGVYSVFFDAVSRRPGARLQRIVAFEPSPQAFRRLAQNLERNRATRVTAYNAAVAGESGLLTFYEPEGHLTNGSLIRAFSHQFADRVTETSALALAATELERFLGGAPKTLIKIDVEGFEPQLLAALAPLILKHQPDLLIEVLDGSVEAIEGLDALAGYARWLIADDCPRPAPRLFASEEHRDWLLTPGPS